MNNLDKKLMVEQLDRKLAQLTVLRGIEVPSKGWINAIRKTLNMSLAQLARRLNITSVSVQEIEQREESKSITLKKMIDVGQALDLQFVYGFLPKGSSIESLIEKQAQKVAGEIVMRTSHTMKLELQENTEERLQQAIKNRAELLKQEMPRHLWD